MCIEMNACLFFDNNQSSEIHLATGVLPSSFGSQSCEGLFRSARSMSSVFSTFINFGMLGLLRRIHRLQVQAIIQAESSTTDIVFPQLKKHNAKDGDTSMKCVTPSQTVCELSDSEIADAVQRAKIMARGRIEKLGMADLLKEHKQWDDQADMIDDIDIVFGDSEDSSDDELETKSETSLIQEMCLDTDSSHVM